MDKVVTFRKRLYICTINRCTLFHRALLCDSLFEPTTDVLVSCVEYLTFIEISVDDYAKYGGLEEVLLLAGPICYISTQYMDFVYIFNISLDFSTIYFAHYSGC